MANRRLAPYRKKPLIVADSSPLIALALLNLLSERATLAEQVILPETVALECTDNLSLPGAKKIQDAIVDRVVQVEPDISLHDSPQLQTIAELVDKGEAQAIATALQRSATILVDDKAGRRCAISLNIPVVGSLGVLLMLKQDDRIKYLSDALSILKEHGYRYKPDLVAAVLKRAGEAPH